jgi:hypothetical protein
MGRAARGGGFPWREEVCLLARQSSLYQRNALGLATKPNSREHETEMKQRLVTGLDSQTSY